MLRMHFRAARLTPSLASRQASQLLPLVVVVLLLLLLKMMMLLLQLLLLQRNALRKAECCLGAACRRPCRLPLPGSTDRKCSLPVRLCPAPLLRRQLRVLRAALVRGRRGRGACLAPRLAVGRAAPLLLPLCW